MCGTAEVQRALKGGVKGSVIKMQSVISIDESQGQGDGVSDSDGDGDGNGGVVVVEQLANHAKLVFDIGWCCVEIWHGR